MKQNKEPCSVVTCFVDYNDKLLLLKRAKKDSQFGLWGIPGGKLESQESQEEGLARELKEELDLDVDRKGLNFLGSSFMKNNCDGEYQLYLYYYRLFKFPKIVINPIEHSDFAWAQIKDFKKYPLLFCQGIAFDLVKDRLKKMIQHREAKCLTTIN